MTRHFWLILFFFASISHAAEILFTEGVGRTIPGNQRSPVRRDPVEYAVVTAGGFGFSPFDWQPIEADSEGNFSGPFTQSGYVKFVVDSSEEKTMFLEAAGNSMVYVNGEPHGGDVYLFGYLSVPVALRKGMNTFLFALGRGQFRAKLVDVPKPVSLDLRDSTAPDVVIGAEEDGLAAVVVRNATPKMLEDLSIKAGKFRTNLPRILPMTTAKVGFKIPLSPNGQFPIELISGKKVLDREVLKLRVRRRDQSHKITFRSKIDGTVQYYAVAPSTKPKPNQALFLSLHGASVEAIGQADSYSAKDWGTIVCPTNRRPYGFNWEDVGRLDAMEVLELAKQQFKPDPTLIYLTGHSMGGHGTWQVGAHYSDQFAAIAPCAGWVSYWSYAGGAKFSGNSEIEQVLTRTLSPSDTLGLIRNYNSQGVFIHHGEADETVPISEAKTMETALGGFHRDFRTSYIPGAGHWWDYDPEPGADATDFGPIFEFFSKRRLPNVSEVKNIDFTTMDPAISSRNFWATIETQEIVRAPSRVILKAQTNLRTISGTSENVKSLTLSTKALSPNGEISLLLDGQKLVSPWTDTILLEKRLGGWRLTSAKSELTFKHGFKAMFDHNFAFVIDKDSGVTMETARYLNEQWRIIANGSVDVLLRDELSEDDKATRNLIYITENSDLLPAGFGENPVILTHRHKGQQIGVIYGGASVTRLPFFTAGAHFPDYFEFTPEMLESGLPGVTRAGFWNQLN